MSTRNIDSRTVLAVGSFSPAWDAFDRKRIISNGANTPRHLRALGLFTENVYDSEILFEHHDPVKAGLVPFGDYNLTTNTKTLGGVPTALDTIAFPDPYELMGDLEAKWKRSEFNAGVFLAEGKEALAMGTTRLRGLFDAANSLRRGNLGGALRSMTGSVPSASRARARNSLDAGDVSSAWLEAHLGWVPMIKDVFSAAQLINLQPRVNRIVATAFRGTSLGPSGGLEGDWKVVGYEKKHIKLIVECSREPELLEALGLRDPAGVLWEATTLSFVADWFLPIGRSLANAHGVGAIPVQKVIYTTFSKLEGKSIINSPWVGGLYIDPLYMGKAIDIRKDYSVKRRVYDSLFPVIGVLGWLPGKIVPKWDPDLWKFATASALAHQAISSLLHRGRQQ